jgi:hypothetical protein
MKNTIRQVDAFYLNTKEPNKSCLLALRSIILQQDPQMSETQKWGMPCFCYKERVFCYLWIDKKTAKPYILMVRGDQLHHPQLEMGKRTKMKSFSVDPNEDLPIETIRNILQVSLDLYKSAII